MLNIENITFNYSKRKKLFESLNLNITGGTIYGLFGENGVGKTTLLKLMCGALTAQSGDIVFFDKKIKPRTPEILSKIFYIPEQFTLPAVRVDQFVSAYAPFYPKFDHSALVDYLKILELSEDSKLKTLSFGFGKRFLIAFALASNCELLIFDEPTNGLDIPSKRLFRNMISQLINRDRAIILSTHQARDLEEIIDQVIILDNSKILLNMTVASITESISMQWNPTQSDKILHQEQFPGGVVALVEKPDSEGSIDLELLFNYAIKKPDNIREIFTDNTVAQTGNKGDLL